MRSTLTSGASGTAPKMSGILEAISQASNVTAHNSGTAWDATIIEGIMSTEYRISNGDLPTELFLGSAMRVKNDAITQKTNMVVNNGSATTIVRTVTSYDTAFGTLQVRTHRYLWISGTDATGNALFLRPEKIKIAYLQKPYVDTGLARKGHYFPRAVDGYLTVEVRNQKANFYATGFDMD